MNNVDSDLIRISTLAMLEPLLEQLPAISVAILAPEIHRSHYYILIGIRHKMIKHGMGLELRGGPLFSKHLH